MVRGKGRGTVTAVAAVGVSVVMELALVAPAVMMVCGRGGAEAHGAETEDGLKKGSLMKMWSLIGDAGHDFGVVGLVLTKNFIFVNATGTNKHYNFRQGNSLSVLLIGPSEFSE